MKSTLIAFGCCLNKLAGAIGEVLGVGGGELSDQEDAAAQYHAKNGKNRGEFARFGMAKDAQRDESNRDAGEGQGDGGFEYPMVDESWLGELWE